MSEYRVCNTDDLQALVRTAARHDLNRVPTLPDNLDPDGSHVMQRVLYGHNMDTAPLLHHRCMLMMKVTGTHDPVEAVIDVLDTDFTRLTDADPEGNFAPVTTH